MTGWKLFFLPNENQDFSDDLAKIDHLIFQNPKKAQFQIVCTSLYLFHVGRIWTKYMLFQFNIQVESANHLWYREVCL